MGGQELHRFRCPQKYLAFDAKERLNTIPVPQAYRLCRAKREHPCRCLGTECQGEQPREEQRFPQSRLQSNKRWLGFSCFSPFYLHRYAPIINSLWVYFQACRRQVSRRLSRTREVRAEWRHDNSGCLRCCACHFLSGTRVNVPRPSLSRFSTVMLVALPCAPIVNVTPLKPTAFSPAVS